MGNEETRFIYGLLYEARSRNSAGLTMVEMIDAVTAAMGARSQTQRRVRDLRDYFDVPAERVGPNLFRYSLAGWRRGGPKRARAATSSRVQAQIFEEYGYRCAMCGRTPKDDGVKLVIDHKVPHEWGGSDQPENLQVLCEEHNHGKQAFFASFDQYSESIGQALCRDTVWERIGELLKAMEGEEVPVELVQLVAREENRGDPTRRLRDLRALGWKISTHRRRMGRRTHSYYRLDHWEPWPEEGPRAVIVRKEAARRQAKAGR